MYCRQCMRVGCRLCAYTHTQGCVTDRVGWVGVCECARVCGCLCVCVRPWEHELDVELDVGIRGCESPRACVCSQAYA